MKKLNIRLYFFFVSQRLCVTLCLAFVCVNLTAKDHEMKTALTEVTVFQSGAQVKRIGSTTIPAGETEIKIKDATALLLEESIQVKGEGNFTILSVNHQVDLQEMDNQKSKWDALEAKQKNLMRQMEELSVKIQVLNAEENTIMNLKQTTTQTKGVTVEQMAKAQEMIRLKLTEIKNEKLKHSRAVLDLFDEHKKVFQQLVALKTPKQSLSYEIVIKVFAKAETKGSFEITYVTPNARWYPTYDLRVKDVASPMVIEYKANVTQESGEDWNNVKLKLSTGDPSRSSKKPAVEPWLIYLNQNYIQPRAANSFFQYTDARFTHMTGTVLNSETGEPVSWCGIHVPGTNIGTTADVDGKFSLVLPVNIRSIYVYAIGYNAQTVSVTEKDMKIKLVKKYMPLNETVKTDYERQLATVRSPTFKTDYDGDLYSVDIPVEPIYEETKKMEEHLMELHNEYSWSGADASVNLSSSSPKTYGAYNITVTDSNGAIAWNPTAAKTLNIVSTEFNIEEKYTIPSDPKNITVMIESITVPATYQYYCAPRLDKDVFITAQVMNWEQYNLLEGQANVFFEGTFTGQTFFDTRYLVDTLEISLGRDKSIKVERKKAKEYNKKQVLGSDNIAYRHWDIGVRNAKKQAIDIIVEDQFPLSADSKIEVTQEERSGGELNEKTGSVKWTFKLEPSTTRNLALRYKVKFPKGNFVGLD
ncbi:MAG TPA: mucoidy inhibitor MuiA family protein [Flavobacteriales bacterium]|nr:mucoidy inhibitor MuiA family protein [Flavobacteriales bacterium]